MVLVDQIAIGFVSVAAAGVLIWVLFMTYSLMSSELGRAILMGICWLVFVVGAIGSVVWLIGRKLI